MPVPAIFRRPIDLAAFYALAPPLAGVAVLAVGAIPLAAALGWYPWRTLLFLLAGGYLYGALPLAAAGLLAAAAARRGSTLREIALVSAVAGGAFAGAVALLATIAWWDVAGWQVIAGLSLAGAVAAIGAASTLALAARIAARAQQPRRTA